jgi:hypothetical protein
MKVLVLTLSLLLTISVAFSQSSDSTLPEKKIAPWFVERFKISAGFFYVINNTNVQVSVTGVPGTDINLEKDFGINKTVGTFLANAEWRVSRRSRLAFGYYDIDRSSTHTLTKDIIFEGNTYPVNATVNSFFNTSIFQFSYGYAIISKPKFEAGLLIGAHVVGSKAGISLVGASTGVSKSNDYGFTAPLPDVGIWGGYAITNRFAVNMDMDYFALTTNNFSGRVLATNFNFTYKLMNKLDVSLGYTGLNFNLKVVKDNVDGRFKWGYNGPALGVIYSFGKKSWGQLKQYNSKSGTTK